MRYGLPLTSVAQRKLLSDLLAISKLSGPAVSVTASSKEEFFALCKAWILSIQMFAPRMSTVARTSLQETLKFLNTRLQLFFQIASTKISQKSFVVSMKERWNDVQRVFKQVRHVPIERRRLPIRSFGSFADSSRTACISAELRNKTLDRVRPKFASLGAYVCAASVHLENLDTADENVFTSVFEEIDSQSTVTKFYFDLFSQEHVSAGLYFRKAGEPRGVFVLANSWPLDEENDFQQRFQDLVPKTRVLDSFFGIWTLPEDLGEEYDLQRFDTRVAGEGQCQDWSLILGFKIAQALSIEDFLAVHEDFVTGAASDPSYENQVETKLKGIYISMAFANPLSLVSNLARLQYEVGILGGMTDESMLAYLGSNPQMRHAYNEAALRVCSNMGWQQCMEFLQRN